MEGRKIVQITSATTVSQLKTQYCVYALCDDNTVWQYTNGTDWQQIKEIPIAKKKEKQ